MMRKDFFQVPFFLIATAFFLTACGYRHIPPEITALHPPIARPPKIEAAKSEIIIVDAGHGGKDAGTSSKKENYEEKTLTLETARLLAEDLKKMGYKIILTRDDDIFVPLSTRAEIANSIKANIFVSIHYNFSTSPEAEGVEIFYYKEEKVPSTSRIVKSKELGETVLKKIAQMTGAQSRGVKQGNFAVVRETKMPAILIEAGFLSNPKERKNIQSIKYRHTLTQGIAAAIDSFLQKNR